MGVFGHADWLVDGLNTAGVSAHLLYMPGGYCSFRKAKGDSSDLSQLDLAAYLLGTCSTIDEVKEAVAAVTVIGRDPGMGFVPPVHCLVHDTTGSIAIEFHTHGTRVVDNPVGIATNAPYLDWHLTNLGNYLGVSAENPPDVVVGDLTLSAPGQGEGLRGIPADYTPSARFVRLFSILRLVDRAADAHEAEMLALHLCNAFDIPAGRHQGGHGQGSGARGDRVGRRAEPHHPPLRLPDDRQPRDVRGRPGLGGLLHAGPSPGPAVDGRLHARHGLRGRGRGRGRGRRPGSPVVTLVSVLAADAFRPEQWTNFFLLVGTGAVTLTGLVFVAMSLNLRLIAGDATHRYRAVNTLTGLALVFMRCALVLMGSQGHRAIGAELFVVAGVSAGIFIRGYATAIRRSTGLRTSRIIGGSVLHLAEMVGAAFFFFGHLAGLYVVAVAMVTNTCYMITAAWLLVIGAFDQGTATTA